MNTPTKKNISILGSTGSIGTQALAVIKTNPSLYTVDALTAQKNAQLLIAQALEFKPNLVVIGDPKQYKTVKMALPNTKVLCGEDALIEAATISQTNFVLTALVGAVGLKPTIAAIQAKKNIGLANKETLVVAGELIMQLAKENNVEIIPIDSEHSAIYQCLVGETNNPIEKIYLTASGGPFFGKNSSLLTNITKQEALKHPNWTMGEKITIDSATLMNKGLEVIEAKWLFNLDASQIEVIVHPQSIIHSIVQFTDGSMKAQMGLPDMKLPIQYALSYPNRIKNNFERFNFLDHPKLTFAQPDTKTFRNLQLAFVALHKGGNMPCIINAANEVVVTGFLENKIGFLQMSDVIDQCMHQMPFIEKPTLNNYLETDKHTRIFAEQLIKKTKKDI